MVCTSASAVQRGKLVCMTAPTGSHHRSSPITGYAAPRGVPSGFHGSWIADTELGDADLGATGLADGLADDERVGR